MGDAALRMSIGGWIFLGVAWISVFALTVFCIWRIFTIKHPPPEDDEAESG